jgi:translation elongation factor EF-4
LFETSAKTGKGIQEMFEWIAKNVQPPKEESPVVTPVLNNKNMLQETCCQQ